MKVVDELSLPVLKTLFGKRPATPPNNEEEPSFKKTAFGFFRSILPFNHETPNKEEPPPTSSAATIEDDKPDLPTQTTNYVHKIGNHVFKFTQREIGMCDDNCWLNDDIIDYYLCLLHLQAEARKRVEIFPAYFYTSLTRKNGRRIIAQIVRNSVEGQLSSFVANLPDILSKDYLIFPIVRNAHWFLAVIMNPGAAISRAEEREGLSTTKETYLVVFDSLLEMNPSRHKDTHNYLTTFLSMYFELRQKKMNLPAGKYNYASVKLIVPKGMTQQANEDDCGVFLLKFADLFLRRLPELNTPPDFSSWWSSFSISGYRSVIRQALITPVKDQTNDTSISSPKQENTMSSELEVSTNDD